MSPTLDPLFADALRRDLITHVTRPAHRLRRRVAIGSGALAAAAVLFGSVTAAPGRDMADPPMGDPILVNGVGPTDVLLPPAPEGATYLHVELACYDATICETPGGGGSGEDRQIVWQRDAIPLTDAYDPTNAQDLDPLDPSVGLPIRTDEDAHWRLYAAYADRLNPRSVALPDGRSMGIPGNLPTSLVPIVADNGSSGYVDLNNLLDIVDLTSTAQPETDPLPVYDEDGTTVIGEVTVDTPYQSRG